MPTVNTNLETSARSTVLSVGKRIEISGQVQGVGFRPFVSNLARELALAGFVVNNSSGVRIEVEGSAENVAAFLHRLHADLPPLAVIHHGVTSDIPPGRHTTFAIRESDPTGEMRSLVLPDIATCAACLEDIHDPENRRYRYPFTNCTNCGPRYSIIEDMPYDRPRTTMAHFEMCAQCRVEYENPMDRRFHAQPIACPQCGPHLALWSPDGEVLARRDTALARAAEAITAGRIVALKGLGGFQLLVDACNAEAVFTLSARKHRKGKPFAVMFPSLDSARAYTRVTPAHAHLLQSPESPIVLVSARPGNTGIAAGVTPDTAMLGVMLPYTPLHHLLLKAIGGPVVATSGNRGEEPICIHEREALERLAGVADLFLVHDRPIARQVDDAVVTLANKVPMLIRRARGYAPAPLTAPGAAENFLAVGGHLKNTVSFGKNGYIFTSQHIGDLENAPARDAFQETIHSMQRLFQVTPERIVHDLHPDYGSTRFARDSCLPATAVQHHYAHVLSCMAEHRLEGPVLGVSWDGTGYGTDGTIWGGEFLRSTRSEFERLASLRPFRLPGGEAAIRDTRRSAISLLYTLYGASTTALRGLLPVDTMNPKAFQNLCVMLERGIRSPDTTSMGRLFDAVASVCGLCHHTTYEGQAAMRLERSAAQWESTAYPLAFTLKETDDRLLLDWVPVIEGIIVAMRDREPVGAIALGFHHALAEGITQVAEKMTINDVILTGGCFQNILLLEASVSALERKGFQVYRHHTVPPNDGGISVGQAWFRPKGASLPCV